MSVPLLDELYVDSEIAELKDVADDVEKLGTLVVGPWTEVDVATRLPDEI